MNFPDIHIMNQIFQVREGIVEENGTESRDVVRRTLEGLNDEQREHLLLDLALDSTDCEIEGSGWSFSLLNIQQGHSANVYYSTELKKLPMDVRRQYSHSMNVLFEEHSALPENESRFVLIGLAILASLLEGGLQVELLTQVIQDRKMDAQVRLQTAKCLTEQKGYLESAPVTFWSELDPQENKLLMPYIIQAHVEDYEIEKAILLLQNLNDPPEYLNLYQQPCIQAAKMHIKYVDDVEHFSSLMSLIPTWAQIYFRENVVPHLSSEYKKLLT